MCLPAGSSRTDSAHTQQYHALFSEDHVDLRIKWNVALRSSFLEELLTNVNMSSSIKSLDRFTTSLTMLLSPYDLNCSTCWSC